MIKKQKANFRTILSWCLFDWGNSAHAVVISTFVFSVYFANAIYGDATAGSAVWANMVGIAALITALTAPFIGAATDFFKHKKQWLFITSFICILSMTGLYFMEPSQDYIYPSLWIAGISFVFIELAIVINNAMLLDIVPAKRLGSISGYGWGAGYLGGLLCLVLCLVLFIGLGDFTPLIALDQTNSDHIRITNVFAALWFLTFLIPLLITFPKNTQAKRYSLAIIFKTAFNEVKTTLKNLFALKDKDIIYFLIASALYRDALITLFTVGGLYASGSFDMNMSEILIFAIGLNLTAGIGALLFGFVHNHFGTKRIILYSLYGLIISGIIVLCVTDKMHFIAASLFLGIFIGPCQSASRAFMAELSPTDKQTEYFGFYALTGKSIAITGPFLFALFTHVFDSQRAGITSIILLLITSLPFLVKIKK